jgi:hypothetical protein
MAEAILAVAVTSPGAMVTLAVVVMQVVAGMVDIERKIGATPSGRSASLLTNVIEISRSAATPGTSR